MEFTVRPGLTGFVVALVLVAVATLGLMARVAVPAVATNRRRRLARHEGLVRYSGHLVRGH